jgi:hypothetical protein
MPIQGYKPVVGRWRYRTSAPRNRAEQVQFPLLPFFRRAGSTRGYPPSISNGPRLTQASDRHRPAHFPTAICEESASGKLVNVNFIRPLLSVWVLLGWWHPAFAGPLFPCVKAVTSKNGDYIVVADRELRPEPDRGDRMHPPRLQQVSLNVLPKEDFINAKDKVIASANYWTDRTIWSVVLDPSRMQNEDGCPLPLITDDGEFLILVQTGPVFGSAKAVLRIYRRRDHPGDPMRQGPDHGVFIKDVALTDLWPQERADALTDWTDETPQWFVGGSFDFSADYREMIVTTRWGNVVHIRLDDESLIRK